VNVLLGFDGRIVGAINRLVKQVKIAAVIENTDQQRLFVIVCSS
jgi:hypothetical protein